VYFPAAQLEQLLEPEYGACLPASQSSHDDCPVAP
jgi:hypothetical protein